MGRHLVDILISDPRFHQIVSLVRRTSGRKHEKLQEQIINFDKPDEWQHLIEGDVLFSALGTTLRQAGGKDAQYKVDFTYQYEVAKAAASNGVPSYVLVSSSGANPNAAIFYPRMKGELEVAVRKLPFKSIAILQPSLLVGKREKSRTGEEWGYKMLSGLNKLGFLKKYRPIEGSTVARAMIAGALSEHQGIRTYSLQDLFELADSTVV